MANFLGNKLCCCLYAWLPSWCFELANNMIYQIAAFAWLTFGVLLVWFSVGDYRESKSG
jgi:hypothetical protein